MSKILSITLAQLNWLVGDIEGNVERMLQQINNAQQSDIILFSELALTGYPAEDLWFRDDLYQRCTRELLRVQQASFDVAVLVGHPWRENGEQYNALSLFWQGELLIRYYKQKRPNYAVFDEQRYFAAGNSAGLIEFKGYRLGLLICEDLWSNDLVDKLALMGAEILLAINASPYHLGKPEEREKLIAKHCQRTDLAVVYLNQIGGQDELVFDGGSMVFDKQGNLVYSMGRFVEQTSTVTFINGQLQAMPDTAQPQTPLAQIYQALVLALHDYVKKNGFNGVILGLSGGIDSALTLAIAVDALGHEHVQAVMMPFRYTQAISIADAKEQAECLAVKFNIVSIKPVFDALITQLDPLLGGSSAGVTEENLQARCRGVILMALSNQSGRLVLTTGNKSEMAVGYATLYGDMAGGFDVLKDVAKTKVFELAKYRNTLSYQIPKRVIERAPSAELAPNQVDEDSLPPYDILDAILEGYIEQDQSIDRLVEAGFSEEVVRKVVRLVDINEYKRRQAAVGPRVSTRSFGKDRRYPITSGFGYKNW